MCNCSCRHDARWISRTLEYCVEELSNHDSIRLPETSEVFHNYVTNNIQNGKEPIDIICENYSYNDCLELLNRFRNCQCCIRHKQNFPYLSNERETEIP